MMKTLTMIIAASVLFVAFSWLPGNLHRFDAYNWFNDHPEKLLEFFGKYL